MQDALPTLTSNDQVTKTFYMKANLLYCVYAEEIRENQAEN